MEKIDAKPEPYRQSVDEALAALGADARLGLSEAEARARLQSYRRNELTAEKPVPPRGSFSPSFETSSSSCCSSRH